MFLNIQNKRINTDKNRQGNDYRQNSQKLFILKS